MPMPMVSQYANEYRTALQNEPGAKDLNGSIAMCYLKLGQHDKALNAFEKAMEDNFDNSDTFFYAAICRLRGKKAFLAQRPEIDAIERDINSALMIEPQKGIYHYFLAYIKYDYFERKSLNTTPTYIAKLAEAKAAGLSPTDVEQLFGILGVSRPDVL
jgi:tetratricopeptide (TPR) repeat protein